MDAADGLTQDGLSGSSGVDPYTLPAVLVLSGLLDTVEALYGNVRLQLGDILRLEPLNQVGQRAGFLRECDWRVNVLKGEPRAICGQDGRVRERRKVELEEDQVHLNRGGEVR